jgi:pantetheine-phosphate adenylyltransferase
MTTAIYPGSFDPITFGHLDVMERAARLFDKLIVAVAHNEEKKPLFSADERMRLIRESINSRPNIEVVSFGGLLVDFARVSGAAVVVRGLRAVTDFEYEFQMALMNKTLSPDLETVFLTSREAFTYLSSRVIKEVARLGGDVSRFVPAPVAAAIRKALG